MSAALVWVLVGADSLGAQQPVVLSGFVRFVNLTNPGAPPFTPDPNAPAGWLSAYGRTNVNYIPTYPVIPPGFDLLGGLTGRAGFAGTDHVFVGARHVFYVLTDTGFQPVPSQPGMERRDLTGEWAVFRGSHTAPTGEIRGDFTLSIHALVSAQQTEGMATGTLTVTQATGTLAGAGLMGTVHDLRPIPEGWNNWLNNAVQQPLTGGDVMFLSITPQQRILPADTYAVAPGATNIVADDADGDGYCDLILTNPSASQVTTLLNDGLGNLSPGPTVTTGAGPVVARAGRLNLDAFPDLVVAVDGSPGLEVYLGLPGGGFGPGSFVPLPSAPVDLELADVSGDTIADVLVAVGGGPFTHGFVRVLINDGAAGFPFHLDITQGLSSPVDIHFEKGYFNAEPDLFVLDAGDLFGSPAGVRMFDIHALGVPLVGSFDCGPEPRQLAVHDLDRDGDRDIIVARYGNPLVGPPGGVDVFRATGWTTFDPPIQVLAAAATSVAVTDIEGKASPDLIVGTLFESGPTALNNWNGSGFASQSLESLGGTARRVLAADLDVNGFPTPIALFPTQGIVSVNRTVPAASVGFYGTGCPGTGGLVPVMTADRLPNLGNAAWAIQITNAAPNAPVFLFLSLRRDEIPFPGPPSDCKILLSLDLPWFLVWSGSGGLVKITDSNGYTQVTMDIPGPAFAKPFQGFDIYAQWAVVDPNGSAPFSVPLALSNGLRFTVW